MDGEIIGADADDDPRLLLRRLIVDGRLTAARATEILAMADMGEPVLGPLLNEVPYEALDAALRDRFIENVCRFVGSQTKPHFDEMPAIFIDNVQLGFEAEALVGDAVRTWDRAQHLQTNIEIEPSPTKAKDARSRMVLRRVQIPMPVWRAVLRLPLEPLAARVMLAELVDSGVIRRTGASSTAVEADADALTIAGEPATDPHSETHAEPRVEVPPVVRAEAADQEFRSESLTTYDPAQQSDELRAEDSDPPTEEMDEGEEPLARWQAATTRSAKPVLPVAPVPPRTATLPPASRGAAPSLKAITPPTASTSTPPPASPITTSPWATPTSSGGRSASPLRSTPTPPPAMPQHATPQHAAPAPVTPTRATPTPPARGAGDVSSLGAWKSHGISVEDDLDAFADHDQTGRGGGESGKFTTEGRNLDRVVVGEFEEDQDAAQEAEAQAEPETEIPADEAPQQPTARYGAPALSDDDAHQKLEVANQVLRVISDAFDRAEGAGRGRSAVQLLVDGSPLAFSVVFAEINTGEHGELPHRDVLRNLDGRPASEHRHLLNQALMNLLERGLSSAADELPDDAVDHVLEQVAGYRQRLGL